MSQSAAVKLDEESLHEVGLGVQAMSRHRSKVFPVTYRDTTALEKGTMSSGDEVIHNRFLFVFRDTGYHTRRISWSDEDRILSASNRQQGSCFLVVCQLFQHAFRSKSLTSHSKNLYYRE